LTLPHRQQDLVLQAIHDGKPLATKPIWKQMKIGRFWQLIMQDAIESYYSHPWAWYEIGFGALRIRVPIPVSKEASPSRGKWKNNGTVGTLRPTRFPTQPRPFIIFTPSPFRMAETSNEPSRQTTPRVV
jgi:hypothetical protein